MISFGQGAPDRVRGGLSYRSFGGLDGAGMAGPPDFLVEAIAEQMRDPALAAGLRRAGGQIADAAITSAIKMQTAAPPAAPSGWQGKVLGPLLGPLQEGAITRAKQRALPILLGATLALLGLGFVGGRLST